MHSGLTWLNIGTTVMNFQFAKLWGTPWVTAQLHTIILLSGTSYLKEARLEKYIIQQDWTSSIIPFTIHVTLLSLFKCQIWIQVNNSLGAFSAQISSISYDRLYENNVGSTVLCFAWSAQNCTNSVGADWGEYKTIALHVKYVWRSSYFRMWRRVVWYKLPTYRTEGN